MKKKNYTPPNYGGGGCRDNVYHGWFGNRRRQESNC